MSEGVSVRDLVPAAVYRFPTDLWVVLVVTVLTVAAVFLPGVRETPIRTVLGFAFVLFVPGYVLVAALFPRASDRAGGWTLDGTARAVLSLGMGLPVVILLGLVANVVGGITLVPVTTGIVGITLVGVGAAAWRRGQVPPGERFSMPLRAWMRGVYDPGSRAEAAMTVVLAVSLVLAVASLGFVGATDESGDEFTEFYLLTETEEGKLVAGNYPDTYLAGRDQMITAGITNQEGETVEYTVIAEVHRVEDNATRIVERNPVYRASPTLGPGESWEQEHPVTPSIAGERLRLTYMLYVGDPPAEPTPENAYRNLHLWIDVSTSEQNSLRGG